MKSVTVETALLADAVQRAARVSPTKGAAFDKASGIMLEVVPDSPHPLRVQATDLEVSYYQRLAVSEVGDEPARWRVPAALVAGWLSNLPMNTAKSVKLEEDRGVLKAQAGRSRSKFRMYDPDAFPMVKPFDPNGLAEVKFLARRIQQVAWAAHRDREPINGVHIDGDVLVACDGVRLAAMPCKVPVDDPVTAPLRALAGVLRNVEDVKLRVTDRRLEMMPDDDTQLTARVYQEPYPTVRSRMPVDKITNELTFDREACLEALQRMVVLVKGERYPYVRLTIKSKSIGLYMNLDEVGEMDDVIDVVGGPAEELVIEFDPNNLMSVLTASAQGRMTLGTCGDAKLPGHFTDDTGLDVWLAPVVRATAANAA